jgi:cellulose biosynthesis protein BcsQ
VASIITFYSYKGGVGRTMAVANIAILLARKGLRVLAVDWDLEAPGLDRYFRDLGIHSGSAGTGLLDLLIHASSTSSLHRPPDWRDYLSSVDLDDKYQLHLLTCGRQDEEYASKVLSFDWNAFFKDAEGGSFIERLREEWKAEYDLILIDSRTGITDSGGVCTIQLPDVLIPVFTTNDQSLTGAKDVALRAQKARQKLAYDRMPLLIFPLPSRFDSRTQYEEARQWLKAFAADLESFYSDWLPSAFTPLQIIERTKLPYVAYFSFGERLPVLTEGTSDPESLGYAYDVAATLISGEFKNAEQLLTGGPLSSELATKPETGLVHVDRPLPSETISDSVLKLIRLILAVNRWWYRSMLYRGAIIAAVLLLLVSPILFIYRVVPGLFPPATPTPTPTPASTPSLNLLGDIDKVETTENLGGGVQVFILLSIRNVGAPTAVNKYRLRITHVSSKSIDFNSPPEEPMGSFTLPQPDDAETLRVEEKDSIINRTTQAVPTDSIEKGWLRFVLPLPLLKPDFMRQSGIRYAISFSDATGKTYQTTYEVR